MQAAQPFIRPLIIWTAVVFRPSAPGKAAKSPWRSEMEMRRSLVAVGGGFGSPHHPFGVDTRPMNKMLLV